ncbi:MarR family transcriptional regulator [Rhodobacter sp. NTK016B]|uniref:MarR family winged helix-turn-helix transcriptional regulator n=1 Tax=Rhodobacter sp. NTK016B TaxID=2759676 RepID=UPI001A8C8D91|nr:MarR family transcriptional regulator [Rhodobacter sp. NTK016B]MBN8290975.1 MarR family transcriptional regulator [Rhodobacter sp. NTK016B]
MQSTAVKIADEPVEAPLKLQAALEPSINFRLRMAQILAYKSFEAVTPDHSGAARYLGLLSIVCENPGMPQHRLAEAVGLQRSSLVPILDRMEKNGVLERRAVDGDRRANAVWATPHGEAIVADLSDKANLVEEQTLAGFSDEEIVLLREMLDRVITNLRAL